MRMLVNKIEGMYHLIAGTHKSTNRDSEEKQNTVGQLTYIESRLHFLIEVRDYLTCGYKPNDYYQGKIDGTLLPPQKYKNCLAVFELERQIEKNKKAERQKMQVLEKEEALEMKK